MRDGHLGDVVAATGTDTLAEGAKRTRAANGLPGGFNQQEPRI